MLAFYDRRPPVFEAVGNGSYLYNWNIKYIPAETEFDAYQWQCEQVTVFEPLSSNKIVQKVIAEIWGLDVENKMLNEYNAAKLGLYNEHTAAIKIETYKSFLQARDIIKSQIDEDCKEAGIL